MTKTITLLGDVGTDIVLSDLVKIRSELDKADDIVIEVNSFGGSVFEGLAIYNFLTQYRNKLSVHVLGVAASAASLIAIAASEIYFYDGAMLMIHNPWGMTIGDADDTARMADSLAKIRDELALIYADRFGIDIDEALQIMAEETWLTADDISKKYPRCAVMIYKATTRASTAAIAASAYKYEYATRFANRVDKEKKDKEEVHMNEGLTDLNDRLAKIEAVLTSLSTVPQSVPVASANPTIEVGCARVDSDGKVIAKNGRKLVGLGDYVVYAYQNPREVMALKSREADATDGIPIPKEYIADIQKALIAEQVLLPRVMSFGDTLLSLQAPVLNQGGTNGPGGGYAPTYKAEGADFDTIDPKMGELLLTPHRLGGITYLSDKILASSTAVEAVIGDFAREQVVRVAEGKIISGSGTGEPQGIIGASATIAVTRGTANDVTAVDLQKMTAVLAPASRARAIWLISIDAAQKVLGLIDNAKGATVSAGPVQLTIFGLPVFFVASVPLGTAGDVLLVDPQAYALHTGLGIQISFSAEAGFKADSVALKVSWAHDGKPRIIAPIAWATGKTVSTFVKLA